MNSNCSRCKCSLEDFPQVWVNVNDYSCPNCAVKSHYVKNSWGCWTETPEIESKITKLENQNKSLTQLCGKLLDIVQACKDLIEKEDSGEETVNYDSMIKIQGKSFRCGGNGEDSCGCNVFRKLKIDDSKYKCNACGTIWISEL